jgi:hypothetical protein
MKTIALIIALLLLLAVPAAAQTIDGYRLNVYPSGAGVAATPTTFFDFLSTAVTCNLAPTPPVTGVPVNPSRVEWDDPNVTGRICRWTDDGKGPLFSVPFGGSYEAGLQAFNAAGRGPESNRAPFSRLAAPASAPTALRLIRVGS